MAELPTESIQRIADARRQAETELKKAVSGVKESDDVTSYLPAFTSFACALLDAEAEELLGVCADAGSFQQTLESEVGPRIVEGILPNQSLSRFRAGRGGKGRQIFVNEQVTGLHWEEEPDGTLKPAPAEMYAQHGDWERFMPKNVRFLLRLSTNNATVRAVLYQALDQQTVYWVGQFHSRITAGGIRTDSDQIEGPGGELRQTSIAGNANTQADRPEARAASCGTGVVKIPGLKKWEDLTLKFTGSKNLRIVVNGKNQGVYTFSELGFTRRSSKKPAKAWNTLIELANAGVEGMPTYEDGHRSDLIRARITKIRKILVAIFGLKERPIRCAYGKARPSFQLQPPPWNIRDFRESSDGSSYPPRDDEESDDME